MVEEVKTLFYACNPCSEVDSPHPRFLDFVQEARLLYIGSNSFTRYIKILCMVLLA